MLGNNSDLFDTYFRTADLDGDGRISGAEAVSFFQASNLPKNVLAQVWMHSDQNKTGFLGRAEFYNALKLVTVAQSKRDLTPEMVKAALYGPASAKIPAPQINLAALPAPRSNYNAGTLVTTNGAAASVSSQNVRGPHVPANASTNHQYFSNQQNQVMRPPQAIPPGATSPPQPGVYGQGLPMGGTTASPRPPNSSSSSNWVGGMMGGQLAGPNSQVPNRGVSPSTQQDECGLTVAGLTPSGQPRAQATTGQMLSTASETQNLAMPSNQLANKDSKSLVVSGNGVSSHSTFGDVFSATPRQPKPENLAPEVSLGSLSSLSGVVPVSAGSQPPVKPSPLEALQSAAAQKPVSSQLSGKQNQQIAAQSTTASTPSRLSVGSGNSAYSQSQLPWPKMTQSDVQKYTKVFVEVDRDRDGKITGEEARNLFLSWRLPRDVLKQVWDLSDQDNDSMLSQKEFCTALYLMERYREGRPLPTVLPRNILFDETVLSTTGQPRPSYGNASRGPTLGAQPPQVMTGLRSITPAAAARPARPPRPPSATQADRSLLPSQQKATVPVIEKHLSNQLSKEEQDSLNSKFQEATEANKKVEDLEKGILDAKEKIDFFRTKMQELILYKSRCDNRLNEIMERTSADIHEADSLAKKYEEKYKQVGDVASKLTIEEATFRDIQERKMELYQAIVKMEGGSADDGALQDRANHIQSGLEELVNSVNERCKKYGLRVKPTSLVELPFGWQPGIQEGAADWDEDWDNFEEEGFTFVKELTRDVKNVIAPPKPKSSSVQKGTTSTNNDGLTAPSSNGDAKSDKVPGTGEQIQENELSNDRTKDGLARSPPDTPDGKSATETHSQEFEDSQFRKSNGTDGSPHGRDNQSDHGGAESVLSGDRGFDEPSWGAFDSHYDTDSVWSFDPVSGKDMDHERRGENSMFGSDDFGLKPIKTDSLQTDNTTQLKSPFVFADSVPSTPAFNFENSPRRFSEGSEDFSNNFSRFDSFNMHDSGFFPSPRYSLSRFDSMRSTGDFDLSHDFSSSPRNSFARFDSMRSTADFDLGQGFQSSPRNVARFDSFRSSNDFDISHGFPSFDDTDPFGSTGPFRTSLESQTPKKSLDGWNAF